MAKSAEELQAAEAARVARNEARKKEVFLENVYVDPNDKYADGFAVKIEPRLRGDVEQEHQGMYQSNFKGRDGKRKKGEYLTVKQYNDMLEAAGHSDKQLDLKELVEAKLHMEVLKEAAPHLSQAEVEANIPKESQGKLGRIQGEGITKDEDRIVFRARTQAFKFGEKDGRAVVEPSRVNEADMFKLVRSDLSPSEHPAFSLEENAKGIQAANKARAEKQKAAKEEKAAKAAEADGPDIADDLPM